MMIISMNTKNKCSGVEYIPFKKIALQEDESVFIYQNIREEVENAEGKKKIQKIKKAKKIIQMSLSILGVSASLTGRAFASGVTGGTPLLNPLNPGIMMKYGLEVAFIAVSVAVGLSMVLLTIAGIYKMMRKGQEANAWTQDILKGLTQVLISIPSVYVIYQIASYLFRNLDFLKLAF